MTNQLNPRPVRVFTVPARRWGWVGCSAPPSCLTTGPSLDKEEALDGPGHELSKYIAIFAKVADNVTVQVRGQILTV